MLLFFPILLLYLAYINVATYRAFAKDKQFAIDKSQRTPEAELLRLASIGGWGGAKLAQRRLRHKSYKQPFGRQLNTIGILQAACVILFVGVFGTLALAPAAAPIKRTTQTATAAPQVGQPDAGQLRISLRPPAGRPATW